MGPRSHERGNILADSVAMHGDLMLQWGRVLMNAETHPPCSSDGTLDSLQWGRVLMNAETRLRTPPWGWISCFNGAAFS